MLNKKIPSLLLIILSLLTTTGYTQSENGQFIKAIAISKASLSPEAISELWKVIEKSEINFDTKSAIRLASYLRFKALYINTLPLTDADLFDFSVDLLKRKTPFKAIQIETNKTFSLNEIKIGENTYKYQGTAKISGEKSIIIPFSNKLEVSVHGTAFNTSQSNPFKLSISSNRILKTRGVGSLISSIFPISTNLDERSEIHFKTHPENAKISINGRNKSLNSNANIIITPGTYLIEISKLGFENVHISKHLEKGETWIIEEQLKQK